MLTCGIEKTPFLIEKDKIYFLKLILLSKPIIFKLVLIRVIEKLKNILLTNNIKIFINSKLIYYLIFNQNVPKLLTQIWLIYRFGKVV